MSVDLLVGNAMRFARIRVRCGIRHERHPGAVGGHRISHCDLLRRTGARPHRRAGMRNRDDLAEEKGRDRQDRSGL